MESEACGQYQVIHVIFDVVSTRLLPGDEDLLSSAMQFLGDVLYHPVQENGGFPSDLLEQEKAALEQRLAAASNDRIAHAHRRCLEEMCRSEPCAVSPLGLSADLRTIRAGQLLDYHLEGLCRQPIDIFVSGAEERQHVLELCGEYLVGPNSNRSTPFAGPMADPGPFTRPRVVAEAREVRQGVVVTGYRTRSPMDGQGYPSLLMYNSILGEDSHSRLYREIRERQGLCYHVASYLEPMCGLMFVELGVAPDDHREARWRVQDQLLKLAEEGPSAEELGRARIGLTNRVRALEDDRAALVDFALYRQLAQASPSRPKLEEDLQSVTCEDVAAAARQIHLDTLYFTYPS